VALAVTNFKITLFASPGDGTLKVCKIQKGARLAPFYSWSRVFNGGEGADGASAIFGVPQLPSAITAAANFGQLQCE